MSLSLLDSNVWVSLAIDRHKHHRHAFDRGYLQFEDTALQIVLLPPGAPFARSSR